MSVRYCAVASVMQTPGGIFSQFLKDFENFPKAQLDKGHGPAAGPYQEV